MTAKNVMIIGATSAIAQSVAHCFAKNGNKIFLVARDNGKLKAVEDDLVVRGAKVESFVCDISETYKHHELLIAAKEFLPSFDVILIAHGVLGDESESQVSYETAKKILEVNFLSVVSLLIELTKTFEAQRSGCIAVIGSVAGDRGRQSNYIYGTGKGALEIFLQGLRNRLYKSGITVITIKPGFVDTPMTSHLKKGLLFVSPEKVGKEIYQAISKQKEIVYVPRFWLLIMLVIKSIPEKIFKRLSL